jgi:hypothetical protein
MRIMGDIILAKKTFGEPEWKRRRAARKLAAQARGDGGDPFVKLKEYNAARGERT